MKKIIIILKIMEKKAQKKILLEIVNIEQGEKL